MNNPQPQPRPMQLPPQPPMPPGGGRLRSEDLDFIPETSAAMLERAPRGGRIVLWAAVLFFATALSWANWAEVDEITRGSGKVIPSRQVQVIQNLEGGIVAELLVHEGDIVDKGQVLLRIDDTRFSSSLRESRLKYLELSAKAARLRAEAENTELNMPQEVEKEAPQLVHREQSLFKSRQDELESNQAILRQQITQRRQELAELRAKRDQLENNHALVLRELNMTKPLVADGAISEVEVLRLERQVSEKAGELKGTQLAIPRAQSALAEAQNKLEEVALSFRNDARGELNDVLGEFGRVSEANVALEDRVERTAVRSPVHGTVKQLLVNTVGGVVQPGMDMLEIVPLEDTLLVEAHVRPKDIAFIRPGQHAIVKFTAYDYAIYGGLDGKVEHISADTLPDEEKKGESYYLVKVRTEHNSLQRGGESLPIIPGMMATVDILTGKKTVLHYLLKPVLRAKERALRER